MYNTIDVRAASKRGIYVANCPGKNASAVAELVFGMMVALDRRIPDAVASLRAGKWERQEYGKAEGLHGKTLGIAGMGAIGREVAQPRASASGLNVIAWSRSLTPARADELGVSWVASIDELASKSHILSLHLALVERTRHIVNRRVLGLLPERAMLINTARADLVDMRGAARGGGEARAARRRSTCSPTSRAARRRSPRPTCSGRSPSGGLVYGTPHIAAATDQAQLAIATETVRVIRSFLLEGMVPNVVNVSSSTAARFQLVIRMMDKVGHVRERARRAEAPRDQRRRGHEHGLRGRRRGVREAAPPLAPDRGVPRGDPRVRRGAARRPRDAADAGVR